MDSKLFFVCLIALFPAVLATYYPYNCTEFCGNLSTTCTGANQQYPLDSPVPADVLCESACAVLNTTNSTTWTDDTYDCHVYHGHVAMTDANHHCIHAGALGGDYCGTPQQAYCDIVLSACNSTANAVFVDGALPARQLCLGVGSSFPVDSTLKTLAIANAEFSGPTINCHEYHSLVSAQGGSLANTHCPHAGPFGASVCGSPAENFCTVLQTSCPDNYAAYPSYSYCVAVASTFPAATGSAVGSETSGNTLGCRYYHAAVAHYVPDPHCYHTAAGGGDGVCGSTCDGYCSIFQSACGNSTYAYASMSACQTACANFNNTSPYYRLNNTNQAAPSGDTLDCRLYHATAAAAISASTHCPHASPAGGGVCISAIISSSTGSNSASSGSNSASSLEVTFGSMSFVVAAFLFLHL